MLKKIYIDKGKITTHQKNMEQFTLSHEIAKNFIQMLLINNKGIIYLTNYYNYFQKFDSFDDIELSKDDLYYHIIIFNCSEEVMVIWNPIDSTLQINNRFGIDFYSKLAKHTISSPKYIKNNSFFDSQLAMYANDVIYQTENVLIAETFFGTFNNQRESNIDLLLKDLNITIIVKKYGENIINYIKNSNLKYDIYQNNIFIFNIDNNNKYSDILLIDDGYAVQSTIFIIDYNQRLFKDLIINETIDLRKVKAIIPYPKEDMSFIINF